MGMMVSSFNYVSMHPPLVGFFGDNRSSTFPALLASSHWGFSVLREGDQETCNAFRRPIPERFADLSYRTTPEGAVLLDSALLSFVTERYDVLPTGDHQLALAEVREYSLNSRAERPMIYYNGRTARIDPLLPLTASDPWSGPWEG